MWVVVGAVIAAVGISLVASVGLSRANPGQAIPQAGNRRVGLFVCAWILVVAAIGAAIIEGPHPAGGLVVLIPSLALAPLTVVMLRHNAAVRRRDAHSDEDADEGRKSL
ncbi:MAG: hypothetical protein ACXV3F_02120 [Frankiaceae bacterium]